MQSGKSVMVEKVGLYTGHSDCIYTLCKGTTPTTFYSSGADGMVVAWDITLPNQGQLVAKVANSVYALAVHNAAQNLYLGQNFEGIHKINLLDKAELASKNLGKIPIFDIQLLDGKLLCALGNGSVVVLNAETLLLEKQLQFSNQSARRIAISPNKEFLAVAFSDWQIRILDSESLKIKATLEGHTNSVFATRFSPDGKYLLSAGRDAHIKVWDATNNFLLVHDIPAHLFAINDFCFHPTKPLFTTCSMDKSIKVWSAIDFRLLKVIDKSRHAGHGNSVNRLLWLETDEVLVSAGDDRNIHLWKLSL